jgi:hypothetical protein
MLPKHSTLACKFDSSHLRRFIAVMQVMSILSEEEQQIVEDLDIAPLAKALSDHFTKSVLMGINSKSHTGHVTMRILLRHSLQLIYKSAFTASVLRGWG